MSTLGLFNTSHFNPSALPDSMAKTVLTKYPHGQAQLFALSAAMQSSEIGSTTHTWMGRVAVFPKTTTIAPIAQGVKGAAVQIGVESAADFMAKDVLLVDSTDEQLFVESVVGEQSIIVRRGMGHSPAAPIAAGTRLTYIGNAHEEASLRPMMRAHTQEEMHNKTQIFRNAYAASGTATAVDFISSLQNGQSNLIAGSKSDAGMFHAIGIEFAMLFSELHVSVMNGQPLRKMDGLLSMIRKYAPQNQQYAASTTTKKQFDRMTQNVFNVQTDPKFGNDRVLYTGNMGMEVIQEIITNQGQYQFTENQTSFGLSFTTYKTPSGGILRLLTHPLFNTNPTWSRMALIVDPSSMAIRYLKGRKTLHKTFNQNVNSSGGSVDLGIDAEGGDFLSELTMECIAPEANAVIYGLTQAACEPCVPAPTVYEACFEISHPCDEGPVEPGATIMLQVRFGKPLGEVDIMTPTGIVTITLDANGLGAVQYVMPVAPDKYAFFVQGNADSINTIFTKTFALACIASSQPVVVESNSTDTAHCDGVETATPAMPANSPTLGMIQESDVQ
jgi:hypothetical protein